MANVQDRSGARRRQRHESHASSTYKAFLHELEKQASISEEQAEAVAVAVLCVLEQRVFPTEAAHLEAQLPVKLRELIGRCEIHHDGAPQRFGRAEFLRRVGEHLDRDTAEVLDLVEATLRTVCNHVTPGEIADLLAELPADIRELFPGSPG